MYVRLKKHISTLFVKIEPLDALIENKLINIVNFVFQLLQQI